MKFVQGTTLFTLFVAKWSGKITAEDTDYSPDGVKTPKKLLERGRKPIYPPSKLTIFDTLRKRAEAILLANGVRYMKGFAIPDKRVDDVVAELEDIKLQFNNAFKDVANNFEAYRDTWLAENQEFENVIRHLVTKESVMDKFEFAFYASKIQPLEGFEVPDEVVGNQVLHEVSLLCKDEADRLVDRKTKIKRQELVDKLEPMINKLDLLSFGDSRMLKLLSEFKALSGAIPVDVEVFEADALIISNVIMFLSTCSSPARMEAILNGDFSVATMLQKLNSHDDDQEEVVIAPVTTTTANVGAFF